MSSSKSKPAKLINSNCAPPPDHHQLIHACCCLLCCSRERWLRLQARPCWHARGRSTTDPGDGQQRPGLRWEEDSTRPDRDTDSYSSPISPLLSSQARARGEQGWRHTRSKDGCQITHTNRGDISVTDELLNLLWASRKIR